MGRKRKEKVMKKEEGKRLRGLNRGVTELQEVRKYQSSTELLIWQLPFQHVVRGITQGILADL